MALESAPDLHAHVSQADGMQASLLHSVPSGHHML